VLRRDPRAVTTAAPLRHRAGGAGSRTSNHPRTPTLPLASQQNASPFCDHLRCRVCAGTCWLGPITVWLPVRVLSAPPRTPTLTKISRDLTNTRGFAGAQGRLAVSARKKDRFRGVRGLLSPAAKNRFPGVWEGAARDSVRIAVSRSRVIGCWSGLGRRRRGAELLHQGEEVRHTPILGDLPVVHAHGSWRQQRRVLEALGLERQAKEINPRVANGNGKSHAPSIVELLQGGER
jgi:hypothetical protein